MHRRDVLDESENDGWEDRRSVDTGGKLSE